MIRQPPAAHWCPCGRPLHYSNFQDFEFVSRMVKETGPTVVVRTSAGSWRVPRHYVALHGIKAAELPELAERYRFERVTASCCGGSP